MIRHRPWVLGAALLLSLGLAVVPSSPAWAHAVLLNSDPAPQTTPATPPSQIRLQFSEAVDVPFGSVRVVDNDGHSVTTGKVTRRPGGLEVDIAVSPHPGTNFVSWQVVSNDGHVERGVFPFYVGAPSKGPAHGFPQPATASAAAGWFYGAARFGWFAALFALVGVVVVWRWVWRPVADRTGVAGPVEAALRSRVSLALLVAWLVLLASGVAVLIGQAASDSARSLVWAAHPSSVAEVLRTTAGRWWSAGLIIALGCGLPVLAFRRRSRSSPGTFWLSVLAALLVAESLFTALNGHARTLHHATLGVPSLTVHLLAVGVWVGGLGALILLGEVAWRGLPPAPRSVIVGLGLRRFSAFAAAAVAAVVLTGLVSATLDLSSPSDLVNLAYGRMLLIKIVLLQLALLLGARHLWFAPISLASSDGSEIGAVAFKRSAIAELGVLALIVVAATSLMVMVPGPAAAQNTTGRIDLQRRAGQNFVSVSLTPNQPGDDQLYVLFLDRNLAPQAAVKTATAMFGYADSPASDRRSIPLIWLSDGHFTNGLSVPTAGRYQLTVTPGEGGSPVTFLFKIPGVAPTGLAGP